MKKVIKVDASQLSKEICQRLARRNGDSYSTEAYVHHVFSALAEMTSQAGAPVGVTAGTYAGEEGHFYFSLVGERTGDFLCFDFEPRSRGLHVIRITKDEKPSRVLAQLRPDLGRFSFKNLRKMISSVNCALGRSCALG